MFIQFASNIRKTFYSLSSYVVLHRVHSQSSFTFWCDYLINGIWFLLFFLCILANIYRKFTLILIDIDGLCYIIWKTWFFNFFSKHENFNWDKYLRTYRTYICKYTLHRQYILTLLYLNHLHLMDDSIKFVLVKI